MYTSPLARETVDMGTTTTGLSLLLELKENVILKEE